jgi:hypothetical protein
MRFLDLLAKLGILRWGTKSAVYRSGTERPAEFLFDDVYNAKRDLTTLQDLKDATAYLSGKAAPEAEAGKCPGCGKPVARADRFCHACGRKLDDTGTG